MKLLLICVFAGALLTLISGCATDPYGGGYSPGQVAAQHSTYDATHR